MDAFASCTSFLIVIGLMLLALRFAWRGIVGRGHDRRCRAHSGFLSHFFTAFLIDLILTRLFRTRHNRQRGPRRDNWSD